MQGRARSRAAPLGFEPGVSRRYTAGILKGEGLSRVHRPQSIFGFTQTG